LEINRTICQGIPTLSGQILKKIFFIFDGKMYLGLCYCSQLKQWQ
jgi:hypothetical protein